MIYQLPQQGPPAKGFETTLTRPNPMVWYGTAGLAGPPIFGGGRVRFTPKRSPAPWRYAGVAGLDDYGFLTTFDNSIRRLFGMSPVPTDITGNLNDAASSVSSAQGLLVGVDTQIKTLLAQAQAFDSNADPNVRSRAQATESEANGLLNTFDTLTSSLTNLMSQIAAAQAAVAAAPVTSDQSSAGMTVDTTAQVQMADAQTMDGSAQALLSQVKTLIGQVSALRDDVNSVVAYAQGKGLSALVSKVEGGFTSVGSTLSTSTYIVAGAFALGLLIFMTSPRARSAAALAA